MERLPALASLHVRKPKRWELRLERRLQSSGYETHIQTQLLGEWAPQVSVCRAKEPIALHYASLTRNRSNSTGTTHLKAYLVGSADQMNFHLVVSTRTRWTDSHKAGDKADRAVG